MKLILLLAVSVEYALVAFLLLSFGNVSADSFFPSAATENSKFHFTYTLGFELPVNPDAILEYKKEDISGYTVKDLGKLSFGSLVSGSQMYTRLFSLKDNLVIPPSAELTVGMYMYNDTTHTVGIGNSWLFLGPYQAPPISDIVELTRPVYRNITYYTEGMLLTKGGLSYELGPLGNYMSSNTGSGVAYSRMVKLGKVLVPVNVVLERAVCSKDERGKPGTLLSLKLRNNGVLTEKITIGGVEFPELSPLQEKAINNYFIPGNLPSVSFGVENSVTRCLEKGGGAINFSNPDAHALLLSRNDTDHWLWGASILSAPSLKERDRFCITRLPYTVAIPLPTCEQEPEYIIDTPVETQLVSSSVASKVVVLVKNVGGGDDAQREIPISVSFPPEWADYVKYKGDNAEEIIDGKTLLDSGIRIKGMSAKGELNGYFTVTAPRYLEGNLRNPFNIIMTVFSSHSTVSLVPQIENAQYILSLLGICESGRSGVEVRILLTGNASVEEIQFPFRTQNLNENEVLVEVHWFGIVETFLINHVDRSIISQKGLYVPGEYIARVYQKGPEGDKRERAVAVREKTASINNNCPITDSLSPTPSVLEVNPVVKVKKNSSENLVLGISVTASPMESVLSSKNVTGKPINKEESKTIAPLLSQRNGDEEFFDYRTVFTTLSAFCMSTILFFVLIPRKRVSK